MKTNLLFLCSLLVLLSVLSCNRSSITVYSPTAEDILLESNAAIASVSFLNYEAEYRIKYSTNDDTTHIKGSCIIEKQESDSLLGYKAHIKQNEVEHIYTGDQLYILIHDKKNVIIDDPKKNGVRHITGNIVEGLLFKELIDGLDLQKLKESPATLSTLPNTSDQYWVIEITYPAREEQDFQGSMQKLWISKETLLPEKMTLVVNSDSMSQYEEINLSNLTTERAGTAHYFSEVKLPDDYTIEYYEPPTAADFKTLENGIVPPDFELTDLKGQRVRLSELKGKVVVLDFWYMSCYPCIKALPHLEKLYQTYKSKGVVVLGINSKDSAERKEKLPSFLSSRSINYPTLLATQAVDISYNVKAYPTLYVIDKQGKVMHSQLGFGESTPEVLKKIISKAIE